MNKTIFKYASTLPKTNSVILIANKLQFESSVFPVLTSSLVGPLVNDDLKAVHLLSNDTVYIAAKISSTVTRNGGLIREDLIREMVKANTPKNGTLAISVCLSTADEAVTAMQGITRSFPAFSVKSSVVERVVNVNFVVTDGSIVDYEKIQTLSDAICLTQKLVDMPTSVLDTKTYIEQVQKIHKDILESHGVKLEIIKGTELRDRGFGGLWGVGKAAEQPPALVILSHLPKGATKTMCWVGKGIVYDTGVSGMKVDMGGSAAVLGAFQAHVLQSSKSRPINVHALLCLADNAVDALSTRPDDILHMYSGKTVEVNNTDAEGRLVLADGVAYASKHLNPDVILDIATLTGAVMVGLGKRHAGIVCNDKDLEESMIKMGKKSGNLLFPMLYAPEVLVQTAKQFDSSVADMTNSVSDRMNASSSCAAHFIESNLVGEKWDWEKNGSSTNKGLWVHLDIAGTADISGTATGFGVALLAEFAASF